MADEQHRRISSLPRLSPDEIASRGFASAFRGISEAEVRSFLKRVSDDVASARDRERELSQRVETLEERLRNPPAPTEQQLLDSLGEETARVLRSAQEAAEEIRSRAEDRAALALREAQDEAHRVREAAEEHSTQRSRELDELTAERTRAAEAHAAELRDAAERDAAELRAGTERHADDVRQRALLEANGELESARTNGREMVAEARAVRERILVDLARRRGMLQTQIEDLRAGRERLLEAYRVVKQTLTETTEALTHAEERSVPPAVPPVDDSAPLSDPAPLVDAPEPSDVESAPAAPVEPTEGSDGDPAPGGAGGPAPEPVAGTDPPVTTAAPEDARGVRGYVRSALGLGTGGDAEPFAPAVSADPPDSMAVDALFARLRATEAAGDVASITEPAAPIAPDADSGPPRPPAPDADPDFPHRAARDAAADGARPAALRSAKRVLQDEQNALLDTIRRQKGRPTADATLPDADAQVRVWVDALRAPIEQVFTAGARAAGSPAPVLHDDAGDELVRVAVVPLRDRIAGAFASETGDDEIAGRVNARYREWRAQQLTGALDDVLAAAWARGVYASASEGARLRWVPARPGRCPDCDDNALEATPRGKPFPTGQAHPPAHPGCRCLLVPDPPQS